MIDAYYQNTRPEMLAYLPANLTACLDVGCSNGDFALSVKNKHPAAQVWGVEIFKEAGEQAAKKIDKVIIASAEQALSELPNQHFDCIFFNDSLEHFVDPYSYLAAIRQKLKPGGLVIASIPNIRHFKVLVDLLFRGEWRYTNDGVLDRTHLRFFTPKSMRRLFEEAGFTVLKQEGLRPSRKMKVRIWSWLSFGALDDIRCAQFAVVARTA